MSVERLREAIRLDNGEDETLDLLAAIDRYLEATAHLFAGEMPRSCYEYDDDPLAWEAMSAARANLQRHFLAGVKTRFLK